MNSSRILFTILNYKEKENSERLYQMISPYFSCRILDADSGQRPDSFNGDTMYLPNIYFGGLLNRSIELAHSGGFTYLFFICSDVHMEQGEFLKMKDILLKEDFHRVAIYCPSHSNSSYTFVHWAYNKKTNRKRVVPCIEAMVSMWHRDIFDKLYPCADNKYGWGLDICAAYYAKSLRQKIVVDDRVQLFHPQGGVGKNDAAGVCAKDYISHHKDAEEILNLWHWIYVYRLNDSANILLLGHYKFWCSLFCKLHKLFPSIGYRY